MSGREVSFSIILPTYNRSSVVEETLRRLIDQDYPPDRYEILVCDNSSDETPQMVERVAATSPVPVRLLSSNERLPAVKRNQGLRVATGDFVLFMNDDVWVRPDFLREHAASHAAHSAPVAVLGLVEQSPTMRQNPYIEWYSDQNGRVVFANDTACVWRHRFDPAANAVAAFRSGYNNAPCAAEATVDS